MATVTATDLARRTNQVLDTLAHGESVTITRNNTVLGTITPPRRPVTVREVFQRLQKISPEVGNRLKDDIYTRVSTMRYVIRGKRNRDSGYRRGEKFSLT